MFTLHDLGNWTAAVGKWKTEKNEVFIVGIQQTWAVF